MELNPVSIAASLVGIALPRGAATPADAGDRALHEFEEHHYAAAFEAFATLADQGDAHAARMALLMSDHGSRLCGHHFAVEASRRKRWHATSTADNSVPDA